jgi:glycosyltransferase involved in cell wall biosynthesis
VEEKKVLLAAGGDTDLLNAFPGISDDRKMYVPIGHVRDYPYIFSNFDILLVPLRDINYNLCKSDLPLLEAGIRRIPWIATDIPAFQDWSVGGILAQNKGDWYTALRKLIKNEELRKALGESGRQKAEQREGDIVAQRWIEVFTS